MTRAPGRRAFSLAEVVISTAIVGVLLASVFSVVGMSARRGAGAAESERAAWLARDLLAEIASRPCAWLGPDVVALDTGVIGLKIDEGGVLIRAGVGEHPDRTAFNDIWDYDNWSSSPPVDADGAALPGYAGWTRRVDVDAIDPRTGSMRAFQDTCALVVVAVLRGKRVVHTETLVRSQALDAYRGADGYAEEPGKIEDLSGGVP